jgi:gamma-D-glutamyl-L-lysine dipeptidyl-peptidase
MTYIVNVPVCDLRREPQDHSLQYIKDPLQESQLLFGERVSIKSIQGDWAYIEALEQKKYSVIGWIGYPGWVRRSQIKEVASPPAYNLVVQIPWISIGAFEIPFGVYLQGQRKNERLWTIALPDQSFSDIPAEAVIELPKGSFCRHTLFQKGLSFLQNPYLWGGRSAYKKGTNPLTSVDCSGLINLLYRYQGLEIPRDAHDQRLYCKEIEFQELQMADFVFMAHSHRPERIFHVMLYKAGDVVLEATMDVGYTRLITGKEKLGKSLSAIKSGDTVGKYIVWFGTLKEKLYIQMVSNSC